MLIKATGGKDHVNSTPSSHQRCLLLSSNSFSLKPLAGNSMILPSFQPAHPGISFFGTMENGFAATMVLALGPPPSLP